MHVIWNVKHGCILYSERLVPAWEVELRQWCNWGVGGILHRSEVRVTLAQKQESR